MNWNRELYPECLHYHSPMKCKPQICHLPPPPDAELLQIKKIKNEHFPELKTVFKINKGKEGSLPEA